MSSISVVIPTFNSENDLPKLLGSLKAQTLAKSDLQVIIVDNHSRDQTLKVIQHQLPGATVVKNPDNYGIAKAYNIGLSRAISDGSDYAVFLNADTYLANNCLFELIKAAARHPNSILSPKIYFAPGREFHRNRYKSGQLGKVIWYAGGIIDWANILDSHRGVDEVDHGQFDQDSQIDFATGCCMLVPTNVARDLKGFDEDYFLYKEDCDFSVRAKRAGYEIWFIPQSHLWHINAASSIVGSSLHDYYISRNRMIFGLRWARPRTKFALIRESFRLMFWGRPGQRQGISDFYLGRLGKGSFKQV